MKKPNLNETFNNGGKTGPSIYSDHITDIGAKVLNPLVTVHAPTLSWGLGEPFLPLVTKIQHAITIIIRCVLRLTGIIANEIVGSDIEGM